MTDQAPLQRLRITFGKLGSQKYIGHLDLAKTWERILRRAEIALAYSQGFNARPKLQLVAALPLGITSECELLDMWLERPIPLEGLAQQLTAVSPPGLPIFKIEEVPIKSPPLQMLIASAVYLITPHQSIDTVDLRQRTTALMNQTEILRTRRDKPYDLRSLLLALEVIAEGQIRAEMVHTDQGAGRPDELVDALGLTTSDAAVHRLQIKLRSVQVHN
ncbi:MAG: TIGR03936 family radical SAM-associated protein [Chloroflexota bacterium]